jgi:DNA helicase-2/ATP-dependent DNA helicase PcrA
VNVVDYKTGQFKNAEKKFRRPDPEKVAKALSENKEPAFEDRMGGDYWRQAVFYKILMDNDKTRTWEMRSAEFDFIEPDKESKQFMKQRIDITPEDVAIVEEQVSSAYQRIMNREFTTGCGREDCEWCQFVSDYYAGNKSPELQIAPGEEEN